MFSLCNSCDLRSPRVVSHWLPSLEVARPKTWWHDLKGQSHAPLQVFHLIKDTSVVGHMWGRPHLSRGCSSCLYSRALVWKRKWCSGLQRWGESDLFLGLTHVLVLAACSRDMCHMIRASLGIVGWWPRQEFRRARLGCLTWKCSLLPVSFDGFSGSYFLEAIESHHIEPRCLLFEVQTLSPNITRGCLGGFFFFLTRT